MGDGAAKRETLIRFWQQAEETATALHSRAEEFLKFYLGAATAMTGWFVTNASDKALPALLIACVGVFAAGHVASFHVAAFRVHRRARELAGCLAAMDGLSPESALYTQDDEMTRWLRAGHPATGAIFNSLTALGLCAAYSLVLAGMGGVI